MKGRIFLAAFGLLAFGIVRAAPVPHCTTLSGVLLTCDVPPNNDTLVGPSGVATDSLAADVNGKLYSADATGNIFQVTGSGATFVGPTGLGLIGDLDGDANGLWGYSNSQSILFYYDLGLNNVTIQTPMPQLIGQTINGVALSGAGSIFLSTKIGNVLHEVMNPLAPVSTMIGAMATADGEFGDIDFDPATGILYGVTYANRWWYTIATSNAATVNVSPYNMGLLDITGMAMPVAVPEPATFVGLGLALLASLRARKRS